MTPQQEQHLNSLVEAFTEALIAKYEAGAREHGGNLWDMSNDRLLDEAIAENLDQFTYLATLRQKLNGFNTTTPNYTPNLDDEE